MILTQLENYTGNELVEYIISEFRGIARYSNKNDKRMQRFTLLLELQKFFEICDLSMIKSIIEALSRQVHGADYSYDRIQENIIRVYDKIPVECDKHGIFLVPFRDHLLSGTDNDSPIGCPMCFNELRQSSGGYKRKNTAIFIQEAELKHRDMFDFRLVRYIDATSKSRNKVTIICLECNRHGHDGIFSRHPSEFLRNRDTGCPICRKRNWSARSKEFLNRESTKQRMRDYRKAPSTVYYLRITIGDQLFYKIGVTSQKLNVRMWQIGNNLEGVDIRLIGARYFESGADAYLFESEIINDDRVIPYRYKLGNNSNNRNTADQLAIRGGEREIFTIDIRSIIPDLFKETIRLDDYHADINQQSCFYFLKLTIGNKVNYVLGSSENIIRDVITHIKSNNPLISNVEIILTTKFTNNFSSKLIVEYILRDKDIIQYFTDHLQRSVCEARGSELLSDKLIAPILFDRNIFNISGIVDKLKNIIGCFTTDEEFTRIDNLFS